MGFYINPPDGRCHHKGQWLIDNHNATEICVKDALDILESKDNTMGVICVVDNGPFEAAAFCFNTEEFHVFTRPGDCRPKEWFAMDRKTAEELSDYHPIPGR